MNSWRHTDDDRSYYHTMPVVYSRLRRVPLGLPRYYYLQATRTESPSPPRNNKGFWIVATLASTTCFPEPQHQHTLLDNNNNNQRRDFWSKPGVEDEKTDNGDKAKRSTSVVSNNKATPPPPPTNFEIFDIRRQWDAVASSSDAANFWNRIFPNSSSSDRDNNIKNDDSNHDSQKKTIDSGGGDNGNNNNDRNHSAAGASAAGDGDDHGNYFRRAAQDFLTSLMIPGGLRANPPRVESIQELVAHARDNANHGDIEDGDNQSLAKILEMFVRYKDQLGHILEKYLGNIQLVELTPTALFYYLEHEDERKNPSWKRRRHRFHSGVSVDTIRELKDALYLSELSYADAKNDIVEGLRDVGHELVYLDMSSEPGKPSHFIALKRDQFSVASSWSSQQPLEITMVVRGTKTITDVLTDVLCEVEDYRGGQAHSGILSGGRYLRDKHLALIEDLRRRSGKQTVRLDLIGHSLGAGAASVAGIEFNDTETIDCRVVGFGCPALLSKELSEQTAPFITTVINDSDCVPRMSPATVSNLLLDMIEYDWLPDVKRDIRHALQELQTNAAPLPVALFSTDAILDKFMDTIDPLLESTYNNNNKQNDEGHTRHRFQPVLFPPGTCVHLYRDGHGITGSIAPCTFFSEIDVTRRMIDDHLFFSGYEQVFLEVVRQHLKDHHFRFEENDSFLRKK